MKRRFFFVIFFIFNIITINIIYSRIEHSQRVHFIETKHHDLEDVHATLQFKIDSIYQGLRTISRMPWVRNLNMNSQVINPEARAALQEIYNNLNLSIRLSETYIVPIDMDPDKIDPLTKRMQEPKITFDALKLDNKVLKVSPSKSEDEIEIYEYRIMKEQNNWFKKNSPTNNSIDNLKIPMLSSKEVITCDNSNFDPKMPDDKKRSGIVLSVPFFDNQGKLKGSIVGVILTDTLASFLPYDGFKITSEANQYSAKKSKIEYEHPIYNEHLNLDFKDPIANWYLHYAVPEEVFFNDANLRVTKYLYYLNQFIGLIVVLVGFYITEQNVKLSKLQAEDAKLRIEALRVAALEKEKSEEVEKLNRTLVIAQGQILQTAKLASLGEMAAGIAHELNNPLFIISGFNERVINELQKSHPEAYSQVKEYFDDITDGANRMRSIISNLKDFSRQSVGKKEAIAIQLIIEKSIKLTAQQIKLSNIEITNQFPEKELLIEGDPIKLQQVFINLIMNAKDAIASAHGRSGGKIKFRVQELSPFLRIEIEDNGTGMSEEVRTKIFDAFFTTKEVGKGTGLGGSITYGIIKDHNGAIECTSIEGSGTTFIITLPLKKV